ncbi:cell division protein FtsQ [Luteitalea sp. TBR-22]|uniref:cell division protein FtsQ/DivIB n=1 Tax=Luteitalea sp. TBR-22 TaxID=2802971 RepID=UPI001AF7B2EC|nr:FtsQ-type POTRA domain-containing protein [Luteitalea sp. TBR-22]BCS35655.1 cell division protein FtsQ [Luteitalea sp. TBR-22]
MPPRTPVRGTRRVPGTATRDPRLLRARDGGARGAQAWRARAWTVARIATLAVALVGSGWYVQDVMTSSEAFAVQRLHVIGVSRLSQGEVQGLLDGLVGRNIVRTSLEPWRQKLLASPWVREASLRRALPSTIEVRITERLPMAVARAGDLLLLIDEQGAVVDEFGPRYGRLDLPIVDGLIDPAAAPQTPPDEARVALVSSVLVSLRDASLLGRVSQIDVRNPRNVVVMLSGDAAQLQVGHERFAERVQGYLDMQERLARMVQQVESVDLRFDNRVYVRPRKAGVTFASMPQVPDGETVAEALAEPEDADEQH